ncbi:MAG: AI-2E family transporter [Gemmatimonadaceae bacterium]|nr:AI-2E family transporter [Gemmatimonadaceae bacterium]
MTGAATGRFRIAPVLMAIVVTVLLLLLVGKAAHLFLLLFLAILISLALGALADLVTRYARVPRRYALLIAIVLALAVIVGFMWLIVPVVIEQTQSLLGTLPDRLVAWQHGIDEAAARVSALRGVYKPGQLLMAAYQQIAPTLAGLFPKIVGVVSVVIEVVVVGILSVYLANQPGLYRELLISLFPPVHRDLVRDVMVDISQTLRSWILGQLTSMFMLGVLAAIGFYVLRVPYALTFGLFTGLVAIVPFFGTLISTLLPAAFVLGEGGAGQALAVIGWGIIVHLFESNVISPLIMARRVRLAPVLTIMAILIMGQLLGAVGLLVAVPALAVLDVIVRRILLGRVYEGQGFRRLLRNSALVVRAPLPGADALVGTPSGIDVISLAEARDRARSA